MIRNNFVENYWIYKEKISARQNYIMFYLYNQNLDVGDVI